MPWVCDYCKSSNEDETLRCASCAAPTPESVTQPDLRFCPNCQKRLLALGSPACNHCGRKLPASFTKAKQVGLQRISELEKEKKEIEKSVAQVIGLAVLHPPDPEDSVGELVASLINYID